MPCTTLAVGVPRPIYRITVRVVDQDGVPVEEAKVWLDAIFKTTGSDGVAVYEVYTKGLRSIQARKSGYHPSQIKTIHVTEDMTATLTLRKIGS